jgi:hypothetical protein
MDDAELCGLFLPIFGHPHQQNTIGSCGDVVGHLHWEPFQIVGFERLASAGMVEFQSVM